MIDIPMNGRLHLIDPVTVGTEQYACPRCKGTAFVFTAHATVRIKTGTTLAESFGQGIFTKQVPGMSIMCVGCGTWTHGSPKQDVKQPNA